MPNPADLRADYAALNELIVNCPEFDQLEALLGGFNLFQVLKFEYGEIRHSNVLAWILDPAESHGLDATFLKKWLMRVVHESSAQPGSVVSAIDIDGWQMINVEVRREWRNIDLLLVLTLAGEGQCVICLENKINSAQHSHQLHRYRAVVEAEFPAATRRLFIFLTRNDEAPLDDNYLTASYAQVHRALKESLQGRAHAIGAEPRVLLENYLRLLEENFMDQSDIARLSRRIYQQHRRALDVIIEHRPDNLLMASDSLYDLFTKHAAELGIRMEACSKAYIRFIPLAWDQPGNTHGTGWAGSLRTLVFELNLRGSHSRFSVISGKAPNAWFDPIWTRGGLPPFRRDKTGTRPKMWCSVHVAENLKIPLDDDESLDPEVVAKRIYDWCVDFYRRPDTQEVISLLAAELPKLEEIFASPV